ncbi:hypothetical protein HGP17_27300 [Rhizobium sp. P38BS-XIX]|uniref:hypothetical protein n=1 Tax=Rhizobium sp. P38BS-XIX TaxID=2726740 RepID=UPI001457369E|nr:hypothetical protein [Rhizobium sp. P38BS-XIX]NLS00553.1 hypothetical protein [Rhizobium sp. P38BS-XIX]
MRQQACILAILAALSVAFPAAADESSFLKSLDGNWTGTGTVLRKIGGSPIRVSCKFNINAPGASISMQGNCRGLLIVNRPISANLSVQGTKYSGSYTGPSGASSSLSGARQGNTINLAVHWARLVNGDRDATMRFNKRGSNQLTIQTTDKDLTSGRSVITSDIQLKRQ